MNISINDLTFKYGNNVIFDKISVDIKKNTITTVIGKNGSGKSTLTKLLIGTLLSDFIKYNNEIPNKDTFKKIGIVSFDLIEKDKTVLENLNLILQNKKYNKNKINKRLEIIIEKFDLSQILNSNFNSLNNNQKYNVSIAMALIFEPKVLLVDESLGYVDPFEKEKILALLLELKSNGLTIVHFTNDIEDTLVSDKIVLIDNKKIVLNAIKEDVYKEEKLLNNLGYKLPFMVELSNRLMFYDLIDETIYDMQKMVDTLWK